MQISDYMDSRLVVFLHANARDQALRKMIDKIFEEGRLKDKEIFYRAIVEREKIVSTGIGMGVAIPHAKLPAYEHFFIGIGILNQPVDWNALDGAPVRLIFMIGGPDDKQTEYLQLLSRLTRTIKDEERRKKLLNLNQPDQIVELFDHPI